ncbi:MAG TPA: methyltransferase domain-containing protein [Candidatus Acidoferrales bacterium]|jgi:arsenite methyltransferase|nr:methyltransferase domain-containing protein [Candidatus Acidoferrales bacterium]
MATPALNKEEAVRERYAEGARKSEASLCCPTNYDPALLKAIPEEVLSIDYGCGDPTRYVLAGDTVLDLGSGSGKNCFLACQIAGPTGRVIGVDMTEAMLEVAQRNAPEVARHLGYANVEFRKGKIQDLRLNMAGLDAWLVDHPVRTAEDLTKLESTMNEMRAAQPLVPDDSVDVVISNCVLNLVRPEDKKQLFTEIFRVLKRGGRAVISDIVSDEDVPLHLQQNAELWSGCISGSFREDFFLDAFENAGFYGIEILERQQDPWRTVEGIEFRSVTVAAYKGKQGECWEHKQAVIYKGPFRQVVDDDGHVLRRGMRVAVCEKTFNLYSHAPYRDSFALVPPLVSVTKEEAKPFPCTSGTLLRNPRETKGEDYSLTTEAPADCCSPGDRKSGCC